ncbi:hypothetical protein [Oceanicoccus sp. KOV_DT_Chl]|uniref:hypothetical protein n=1 Tax=Oceanicoccus sp. KOV_DT_Chl TaxID=1904639 RepID=UPI000C7ABE46|nr:hypothetical protein [Oceanicoccus sp. KOV_DT_Chl]
MTKLELSASHRATLFSALLELDHQQGGWDKVFQLLNQGQRVAEQAQLPELAEQLEQGQTVVLEGLKKTGQFLPWELKLIELGLATGNVRGSYQRLRDHYLLQQQLAFRVKQHLKLPLLILTVIVMGLLLWLLEQNYFSVSGAVLRLALTAAGFYLLGALIQHGVSRFRHYQPLGLYRYIPPIATTLSLAQRYYFLANLSQCIESGLPLLQSLKLAAKKIPDVNYVDDFLAVHNAVANGNKLSQALLKNGMLAGVELAQLDKSTATASDAQALITESVYHAYIAQLWFWASTLPLLVYALLPVLCLLLLVSA